MNVQQAVETLLKAGYRANASTILSGYVVVLDPVFIYNGGGAKRTEYEKRTVHASRVHKFLIDRS